MKKADWTPDKANKNPFYAESPDHWKNHRYRNQSGQAKPEPRTNANPVAHCATCKAAKREKAFKIYDYPNDKYFCNETCQEARKDTTDEDCN